MNDLIQNKLAGVVILYNPDSRKTFDNILTYSSHLSKLYILDNSEIFSNEWEFLAKKIGDHVEYIFYGENEGIAKRLNIAAEKASKDGHDYLLTMDQDSSFDNGYFDKYLNEINDCKIDKVGQYGVNFMPKFTAIQTEPQIVLSLITSGSIIDLSVFKIIGGYNESLFIDFVDAEYSYRVNFKGYKVVRFSNVILNHQIGERVMGRSFKNLKITPRIIHSPIRVYYIIRNGLFLIFKFKTLTKKERLDLFFNLKILKNNYLYHPNLSKVYFYTLVGIFDFLRNKMGKK
jgi:rhamnosyltransferase